MIAACARINDSWACAVPALSCVLILPTANCLWLCELAASFHDHHLRHLWDQTGRGDPVSGLHGRQCRGDFTPETVTRCYFPSCRDRERDREWKSLWWQRRRKDKKLESVLLFLLCVPVSWTLTEVCLFCQSAETSVAKYDFCLLVLHLQDEGGWLGALGTHGWYVGTFAKVNLVMRGYSIRHARL